MSSYSSITSSKVNYSSAFCNDPASHPPKSSFHKESFSANNEPEKPLEEYPPIIKEIFNKIEIFYKEIQRVSRLSEELMSENRVYKDEYMKLKLSLDQNSNENYERNFIRRLADLRMSLFRKEEEISKMMIFNKKLENENNHLKKETEIKNSCISGSAMLKNDLRGKLAELEAKNAILIKEINSLQKKDQ